MNTQSRWDFSIFWQEALNQLKNELSDQEFVMWFSNISYHSSEEGKLILSVPSAFYRDQVKQRYTGIIKEKLYELSGFQLDVDFIVTKRATSESPKEKNEVSDTPQPPMAVKPVPVSVSPAKNDPPKKASRS